MNWRVRKSTHRPAVSLPDGQPSLLLQSTRGDWQQNFLQRQVLWTSPDGAELRRIACVFNLLHVSTPLGHPALYMSKPRSDMKSFCWNLLHAQPRPGSKGGAETLRLRQRARDLEEETEALLLHGADTPGL